MQQIQYLCNIISSVEWSGLLFYSQEGTIERPEKMIITLEDILPMDKGSVASTEFEYDERYVNYIMEDEKRMEWKHGMIHSHNNMGVFFSGTDQEDLKKNSKAHNYYLSVVVNNKMDMIGKIAFTAEVTIPKLSAQFYALNEDGKKYFVEAVEYSYKKEKLYTYDCNLEYDIPKPDFHSDFLSAVSYIINPPLKSKFANPVNQGLFNDRQPFPSYNENDYGDNYPFMPKVSNNWNQGNERTIYKESRQKARTFVEKKVEKLIINSFGYFDSTTLEDVLEDLQSDISNEIILPEEIVDGFIDSYVEVFSEIFPQKEVEDLFLYNIMIEILKQYISIYPFVDMLYNTLENGRN